GLVEVGEGPDPEVDGSPAPRRRRVPAPPYFPSLALQFRSPVSSAVNREPSAATTSPTGRPQREPSASCQPVTKSRAAVGRPLCTRMRTTFAPVGTLRFQEPWYVMNASP